MSDELWASPDFRVVTVLMQLALRLKEPMQEQRERQRRSKERAESEYEKLNQQ